MSKLFGLVALLAAPLMGLPLMIVLAAAPAPAPVAGVPAEYVDHVQRAAAACPGLPAPLLAAQLARESAWRPDAVSAAGALGLAQFMPGTWQTYGVDASGNGVADPRDPVDAIWSAALYDCHLRRLVAPVPGNPDELMLAAYNAGPYAVLEHRGVPPFAETQEYVRAVLASLPSFAVQAAPGAEGLTPRAAAVRQIVVDLFGVTDIGGFARDGHIEGSDHYTGRAVDVMLTPLNPANTALGWRIATYMQSNARRVGITYIIWQGRIWSVARAAEGWRPYKHPSNIATTTSLHMDHVHISVA